MTAQPDLFGASAVDGPNTGVFLSGQYRRSDNAIFAQRGAENPAEAAINFMESLRIPQSQVPENRFFSHRSRSNSLPERWLTGLRPQF